MSTVIHIQLSAEYKHCVIGWTADREKFEIKNCVRTAIFFVNNQLDAQFFFMYVYFYCLHVSGSHVPIIRRINP